jgi:histidyl-tRNA synthetase
MGCKECRTEYNNALKAYFADKLDGLCPTCRERYSKNPLRILDCKEDRCKTLCKDAPKITEYLCDDCNTHFEKLKDLLTASGIEFEVNPFIVRGLDYYTKTVFEFVTNALGSQGTVCGGGRYDNLIAQLGGNPTCGVGFGMGLERILMLMEAVNAPIPNPNGVKLYVASMGDLAYKKAYEIVTALRKKGVKAEVDHAGRGIKAQFKYADKIGAKYVYVIGADELAKGEANLKKMADGSVNAVKFDDLVGYLNSL